MLTLGQHPSQQDARVQNQPNVSAGTKRLSAERRRRNHLDDDTTRSQSFHAQSVAWHVGRTNFSPEVPERPVQETKLGGSPTRVVCRGAPHLPHRCLPVHLGDMFGEVSPLSRFACSR